MFSLPSDDLTPPSDGTESRCAPDTPVFDMEWKQVLVGDYVLLPCFNSVVDRAMVVGVHQSLIEFVILSPDSGVPESIVLDMRRPDPNTGLFGRYGYTGVMVCARRGEPAAQDFARQLLAACEAMKSTTDPKFNPYLVAQARSRLQFLQQMLLAD